MGGRRLGMANLKPTVGGQWAMVHSMPRYIVEYIFGLFY